MPRTYAHKDLTGLKFGKWTVISFAGHKEHAHHAGKGLLMWNCKCECGGEKTVAGVFLSCKKSKSCGCVGRGKHRPVTECSKNSLLRSYKNGARDRNLEWSLSPEFFMLAINKPCYYCGVLPSTTWKFGRKRQHFFLYNGLDRLENSLGYTESNIVTCCKDCNFAKRGRSYSDFVIWINRIKNFNIQQKAASA